jgi:hypothetical protein
MIIVFSVLIMVVAFFCVPCGDYHLFLCSKYGHHFFNPNHSCCFFFVLLIVIVAFSYAPKVIVDQCYFFFCALAIVIDHCHCLLLCS